MTTKDLRPEVAERLLRLDPVVHRQDAEHIEDVISAYLAGARNDEARDLARLVFAEHREFFDLIGDR
jgi:hypothetical protein